MQKLVALTAQYQLPPDLVGHLSGSVAALNNMLREKGLKRHARREMFKLIMSVSLPSREPQRHTVMKRAQRRKKNAETL